LPFGGVVTSRHSIDASKPDRYFGSRQIYDVRDEVFRDGRCRVDYRKVPALVPVMTLCELASDQNSDAHFPRLRSGGRLQ